MLFIYSGIITIKRSPYFQNTSDYVIRSENDYLYIKFRDNEFLVKKETFKKADLYFRDKNNKYVSSTKASQIYQYVSTMYKDLLERETDSSKTISKSEVVDKFSNVRPMTYEEKLDFINEYNLKNRPRFVFLILSILFWLASISFLVILLSLIGTDTTIYTMLLYIIILVVFFILGLKTTTVTFKNMNLIRRVLAQDMYIVECKIFDKKSSEIEFSDAPTKHIYSVKITDGNYVVDNWINIPEEKYNKDIGSTVKFYVFDRTGSDLFVIS